jgi:hypothetical protein
MADEERTDRGRSRWRTTRDHRIPVAFALRAIACPANRSASSPKDFAEAVERTPEFRAVLLAADALETTEAHSKWITGQDRIVMSTFLHMSAVYLSLHSGTLPDAAEVAQTLRSQLLQSQIEVTHLAPIELVELSKDQVRFGQFRIEKFAAADLDRLLQNPLRRAFYPWAVVDTQTLEDYSFLVATETVDVRPPLDLAPLFDSRVKHMYSDLPKILERTEMRDRRIGQRCATDEMRDRRINPLTNCNNGLWGYFVCRTFFIPLTLGEYGVFM